LLQYKHKKRIPFAFYKIEDVTDRMLHLPNGAPHQVIRSSSRPNTVIWRTLELSDVFEYVGFVDAPKMNSLDQRREVNTVSSDGAIR
jgi:hypothetical protein